MNTFFSHAPSIIKIGKSPFVLATLILVISSMAFVNKQDSDILGFLIAPEDVCSSLSTTEVGGYAWEDWNYNGIRDENCIIPVCGVEVEIWSCDDMLIGTSTTDGLGQWTFDLASATLCEDNGLCDGTFANNYIRIEYVLPDSLCYLNFTFAGSDNGTSVQFITPGECAPIGAARPDDYCEDENPTILAPCYSPLRPESTTDEPAIVYWDYNDEVDLNYTTAAYLDDVGSVWGVAKDNINDNWFYSSIVKRHAGLGPDGIGAIYMQTDIGNTSSVTTVFDFGSAAGSIGSNASRGLPTSSPSSGFTPFPSYDTEAFWKVGKEGIGDIEYCTETERLYAVNLFDRTVYEIDASNSTAAALGTMPWISNNPCGSNGGTARPWGLKKRNKKLYVGVVCDAAGGNSGDLTAHLYCYDFTSGTWNTTPRLSFDLDYRRQHGSSNPNGSVKDNGFGAWRPWNDNYNSWVNNGFQTFGTYAQPIFSDIEFDDNGDLIMGFMDRGSHQMGHENYRPQSPYGPGGTTLVSYVSAGDILRAGLDDKSSDPTFTLESNGITNGIHKTRTSTRSGSRRETIPYRDEAGSLTITDMQPSGPGGLEFYWGEKAILAASSSFSVVHYETSLGALAILRGSEEVVLNVFDPQTLSFPVYRNGLHKLSNATGERTGAKILVNFDGGFAKASGVGDLEICCLPPPIQIGNYVWEDIDGDGIQDPCEPGLANVEVTLYKEDASGCCTSPVTVTTDANGQYYFEELEPNTTYHIVVGGTTTWDPTNEELTLNGTKYSLTDANQTQSGNTTDPDNIDSDGVISTNTCCSDGYPSATVTTGEPGESDHSLDFGFSQFSCPTENCFEISVIRN